MRTPLRVAIGQASDKGRKESNQDFHGALVPKEPLASLKGVCIAVADGISSSAVSAEASEAAVRSLLEDYYCTSEAWSVKTSVERVMSAANSWLHAQTLRNPNCEDSDRGYVCTFSAVILRARTAHVFHVGDSRVYRVSNRGLEQLTQDHRVRGPDGESYLARALGAGAHLELDYDAVPIGIGSTFLLATDGVFEGLGEAVVHELVEGHAGDLDEAAQAIVRAAYDAGSGDNLTVQLVRVESVPTEASSEILHELAELPLPPELRPRMPFDGYTIQRELHASPRSRVYLAVDDATGERVVLKTPAVDLRADSALLERFLIEEWIARRIDNPHVLRPGRQNRPRHFVYLTTEYVEGNTLAQWMRDHPRPDVELVRGIIEQIARGLLAFHKLEMVHQDLRPDNVLIDATGTVKIIDFGSVQVAGIVELVGLESGIFGTLQYTAPEYFLGEPGSSRSDLFSLAVIAYEMLSGRLPYGAEVPKCRTRKAQSRLLYVSVRGDDRAIPGFVDDALARALRPNPSERYAELSAFLFDLRHPSRAFLARAEAPLLERSPAAFWKGVSLLLALMVLLLLLKLWSRG
jgi:serine/threonine protein phosphatase PrpC